MTPLEKIIRDRIAASGPMDVASFMELAVTHYYATRDPLGLRGDFTTAPEISQMFGELIGLWAADVWLKLGKPAAFQLIECGPGRGTLMADVLRAGKKVPGFTQAAQVVLIENSPVLIEKQTLALKDYKVVWAQSLDHAQIKLSDAPLILLANEFLDALPIRQTVGNKERVIVVKGGQLAFEPPGGAIRETSPACENFVRQTAQLLKARRGAALFVDYGYEGPAEGDTLQAIRNHQFADVLAYPGESDLTAHVDFGALKTAALKEGVKTGGPVGQGDFLFRLGINQRADVLLRAAKDMEQSRAIAAAVARLTEPEQMGRLFKVMALWHDGSLAIEGF